MDTMEQDFCFEGNLTQELNNATQPFNVGWTVLNLYGPGGWPVVRFSGSEGDLTEFARAAGYSD